MLIKANEAVVVHDCSSGSVKVILTDAEILFTNSSAITENPYYVKIVQSGLESDYVCHLLTNLPIRIKKGEKK